MPFIPPEILPLFDDLGILSPAESPWKRLPPQPIGTPIAVAWCDVHDAPEYMEMSLTRMAGRRIYIGQCPQCRTVFVRDAIPLGVPL